MESYIRVAELAAKLNVSESTIWRWANEGKLPRPMKLSRRVTVWNQNSVQLAIQQLGGDS